MGALLSAVLDYIFSLCSQMLLLIHKCTILDTICVYNPQIFLSGGAYADMI